MKKLFSAVRRFVPLLSACIACLPLGPRLWGRWFDTGGEALYGGLFCLLVVGVAVRLPRVARGRQVSPDSPSTLAATGFLLSACVLYPSVPFLISCTLLFSALYWSLRAALPPEERRGSFALWPLLLLSLPHTPAVQFVLGYPLRVLAARFAAALLPGGVRATGCGLSDGIVEVFVDAPCAGAGMLSAMLLLAAGIGLIFRLGGVCTTITLFAGLLCALTANALRAMLLFAGYAGLLPAVLRVGEAVVGLSCFATAAAVLFLLAYALGEPKDAPVDEAVRVSRERGVTLALLHLAASILFLVGVASVPDRVVAQAADTVLWPSHWEGRLLVPVAPTPDTERFWRDFPGACREFALQTEVELEEGLMPADRLLLRFVRGATRQLHPAEDCFRGAGYKILPLPLRIDGHGRAWSGFVCEKAGRKRTVRQCVLSVPDGDLRQVGTRPSAHTWSDVSSWYWQTAAPGSPFPPTALAVTLISE